MVVWLGDEPVRDHMQGTDYTTHITIYKFVKNL